MIIYDVQKSNNNEHFDYKYYAGIFNNLNFIYFNLFPRIVKSQLSNLSCGYKLF